MALKLQSNEPLYSNMVISDCRWWVDCYIWYSEEGTGWGRSSFNVPIEG